MPPVPEHRPVDRRRFLRVAAAGAALTLPTESYGKVAGSNETLRVAFLGCGARAQAHLHLATKLDGVTPVAVCDVWDGHEDEYEQTFGRQATTRKYSQGLYPSAKKCGLNVADKKSVTKDYRRLLDRADVDAVVVSTPDHWHARMTLDALAAGKDVLCETPMTRTAAEAVAVLDAASRHNRIVAVAAQNLADPSWRTAREWIRTGRVGAVSHLSAGVFRNDIRGQWRFLRLVESMTPKSIAWDLWLGHRFDVNGEPLAPPPSEAAFDRATFAQWRCDSRFSGGPFTDLYGPPITRLLAATGLRFPGRVLGAGGLFVEHDGRDVPDVATIAADFREGCHLLVTGSTVSAHPQDDVIRGRLGAIRFARGGVELLPENPSGRAGKPESSEWIATEPVKNETEFVWRNFVDCVARRDRATLCPPELGAATVTIVALAQQSYRSGQAQVWDREHREATTQTESGFTSRSHTAHDLAAPDHQRLAGPWPIT